MIEATILHTVLLYICEGTFSNLYVGDHVSSQMSRKKIDKQGAGLIQ